MRDWIVSDGVAYACDVHFWAHAGEDVQRRIETARDMGYRYDGASGCGDGAWYDFSPACDGVRVRAETREGAVKGAYEEERR